MPQLSPLMWIFSFAMILFFFFSLILLDSNYKHSNDNTYLSLDKNFINLKW